MIAERVLESAVRLLREVFGHGMGRGGVCPGAAYGDVCDVVPAATMYRSEVCAGECNERDSEEMADRSMPPLLRPAGA